MGFTARLHINYAATVLEDAGLKPSDFTFVYFKELTIPKADTGGKIIDPVSAFQADASIAAVFCISPDAATLTSGGKIGSGTEGSVKGAKIILSTKTASQVIVDVLAVRKDWFDQRGQFLILIHEAAKATLPSWPAS
jgi:hypothetical protein